MPDALQIALLGFVGLACVAALCCPAQTFRPGLAYLVRVAAAVLLAFVAWRVVVTTSAWIKANEFDYDKTHMELAIKFREAQDKSKEAHQAAGAELEAFYAKYGRRE